MHYFYVESAKSGNRKNGILMAPDVQTALREASNAGYDDLTLLHELDPENPLELRMMQAYDQFKNSRGEAAERRYRALLNFLRGD